MKKVLFFLLLLVVALAVAPLFLPKTLYVEDEYVFDADVSRVFEQFYDMQNLTKFNVWTQNEPQIQLEYSSPSIGPNAHFTWKSDLKEIGEGQMQIVDANLEEFILYDLTFGELEGNVVEVIFQKLDDDKTKVIWSFDSAEATYPFQVYNWLMKNTVKKQLHESLVNLDSLLKEQNSQKVPYVIRNKAEQKIFGILQSTAVDSEEIETAMAESFAIVKRYLRDDQKLNESQIGKPVVVWKLYSLERNATMFYAGYFLDEQVPEAGEMEYVSLEPGREISTIHKGDYNNLPNTHEAIRAYAEQNGLALSSEWYNVYLNNLDEVDMSSKLRTEINIPIID